MNRKQHKQRADRIRWARVRKAVIDELPPIYLSPAEYRMYVATLDIRARNARGDLTPCDLDDDHEPPAL
jgi:hypothetical protein